MKTSNLVIAMKRAKQMVIATQDAYHASPNKYTKADVNAAYARLMRIEKTLIERLPN